MIAPRVSSKPLALGSVTIFSASAEPPYLWPALQVIEFSSPYLVRFPPASLFDPAYLFVCVRYSPQSIVYLLSALFLSFLDFPRFRVSFLSLARALLSLQLIQGLGSRSSLFGCSVTLGC